MSLSFNTLREANLKRLPLFKDAKGRIAHPHPTGADWSPAEWMQAVLGELGELANVLKKVRRGDYDLEEMRGEIRDELADVVCYLDILALQFGVDLGEAVVSKFKRIMKTTAHPSPGDMCAGCAHAPDPRNCHFFHFPNGLPLRKPDGALIVAAWMLVCDVCFEKCVNSDLHQALACKDVRITRNMLWPEGMTVQFKAKS